MSQELVDADDALWRAVEKVAHAERREEIEQLVSEQPIASTGRAERYLSSRSTMTQVSSSGLPAPSSAALLKRIQMDGRTMEAHEVSDRLLLTRRARFRRRVDYQKRLMLLTVICVLPSAIARLPITLQIKESI